MQVGQVVYLDNAATVYPKPKEVIDFMCQFYSETGVSPGRSGHDLGIEVEKLVKETRKLLTKLFKGTDSDRLVFTYNASDSLNIIINGILKQGDHVVTTNMEHNSVLRPLYHLQYKGIIEVDHIPVDNEGYIDPDDVKQKIKKNTRLVMVNHASNVLGTIQPVAEIGKICKESNVIFCLDVAQTAGVVPIDVQSFNVDVVAFTGHKSLLGPTGIGGIYVGEGVEIELTRSGGTGVRSAYPFHLPEYPYRLEVGTLNVIGIAGLNAGQKYITKIGLANIYREEMKLFNLLQEGLEDIGHIMIYGTKSLGNRTPVLSLNIEGYEAFDVGIMLNGDYNIAVRTGLQCAPKLHEQLGTNPTGTVRFSIGPMNTEDDILQAIQAVGELAVAGSIAK